MAGINVTSPVLTIENSSRKTKLESLKSKLLRKIIAMKSYFIDELWSLKNELENSFLKGDVTDKHKLIDTLLQYHSKISQKN